MNDNITSEESAAEDCATTKPGRSPTATEIAAPLLALVDLFTLGECHWTSNGLCLFFSLESRKVWQNRGLKCSPLWYPPKCK